MSNPTPGPWVVNPVNAWVELPGKDEPICALCWPTDIRSEDETFANARLIAAAPTLLEALKLLVKRCGPLAEDGKIARAAISQAIGEGRDV